MNDADEGDTYRTSFCLWATGRHPTSQANGPISIEWAGHSGHAAHLYLLATELLLPKQQ